MNAWQTKSTDAPYSWHTMALEMKGKPVSMTYKGLCPCLPCLISSDSKRVLVVLNTLRSWRMPHFLFYLQTAACFFAQTLFYSAHMWRFKRKPFPILKLPRTPRFHLSSPAALDVSVCALD